MLRLTALALLVLSTSACGRLNPMNFFQSNDVSARAVPRIEGSPFTEALPMVDVIQSVEMKPTSAGMLLTATGVTPTQGYWQGTLVRRETADADTVGYDFIANPPLYDAEVGAPQTREITVAADLTEAELNGISEIIIFGGTNAHSIHR